MSERRPEVALPAADLGAVLADGPDWLVVTSTPDRAALVAACAEAKAAGVRVEVQGIEGHGFAREDWIALRDAGLGAVRCGVAGDDAGAAALRAAAGLDHLRPLAEVRLGPHLDLAAVVALLAEVRPALRVDGTDADHATRRTQTDALLAVAASATLDVRLQRVDAPPPWPPPTGGPQPLDPVWIEGIRERHASLRLACGTEPLGDDVPGYERWGGVPQVRRLLADVGYGAGAPRPSWTGVGPGAHVVVVLPPVQDKLQAWSTFPALPAALRAAGATARLASALHGDDEETLRWPDDMEARAAAASRDLVPWFRALDLSDADAVIAPGWDVAGVVFRHPTLRPDARVIVADDHLLQGLQGWLSRYRTSGRGPAASWWPDARVHVHATFPSYARSYWMSGVPLGQVWWRPYPVACDDAPTVATEDVVFCGGAERRDHDLLAAALRRRGEGLPVDLVSPDAPRDRPPGLSVRPRLPLRDFWAALARARYVVVPARHEVGKASGISVLAMAHAAGVPVIATATRATLDLVRAEDGLLVPHGDADALAAAMRRLDGDDGLRDRLAAGARRAGAFADVATWAHHVVQGGLGGPFRDGAEARWVPWRPCSPEGAVVVDTPAGSE